MVTPGEMDKHQFIVQHQGALWSRTCWPSRQSSNTESPLGRDANPAGRGAHHGKTAARSDVCSLWICQSGRNAEFPVQRLFNPVFQHMAIIRTLPPLPPSGKGTPAPPWPGMQETSLEETQKSLEASPPLPPYKPTCNPREGNGSGLSKHLGALEPPIMERNYGQFSTYDHN